MYMTDEEIAREYRLAKEPTVHVKVLADLNACDVWEIEDALTRQGIVLKARKVQSRRKLDPVWAKELYDMGFDDREIGKRLGVAENTVRSWRDSLRLIPHIACDTRGESRQAAERKKSMKERNDKAMEKKNDQKAAQQDGAADVTAVGRFDMELLRVQRILETATPEDDADVRDELVRLCGYILRSALRRI